MFTSFVNQQSDVIKAEGRVLLEPAAREFCLPERVLLLATWASEADFMKLLRDMKNEQCFSQVFSKQEFFLCQCCAYKGNLFLWARFWMGFFAFFDLRAWISGEGLNHGEYSNAVPLGPQYVL